MKFGEVQLHHVAICKRNETALVKTSKTLQDVKNNFLKHIMNVDDG